MKLVICTKFQVNRMNCVESRRGGPIDTPPPSRLRVTIFSRRLLGLNPRSIADLSGRSHPLCKHAYWTNIGIGKKNRIETVKLKFASNARMQLQ